jgi:FkbM family methyltransferase
MSKRKDYILSEPYLKSQLLHFFSKENDLVILDIGGCEGEDSIKYSRLFPNAKVYVFEPLPANQDLIKENLNKYNIPNVTLMPFALSDNEGEFDFYVSSGKPDNVSDEDWDYGNKSSSLLPPDKHKKIFPWVKFEKIIKVPTKTLDLILKKEKLSHVDFIHMDVQGSELKVLQGAGDALNKIKIIWMEVSNETLYENQPIRFEVEKFMFNKGFHLYKNAVEGVYGDQMYINLKYFKKQDAESYFDKLKLYIKHKIKS